jgi:hypothetical protein
VLSETMIFAIGRTVERLLADAMFGVSLILGWNLFRVGVLNDQTAEMLTKNWKIRLQRVGPGVFFALFGALGLAVAIRSPLEITNPPTNIAPGTEQLSYATGSSDMADFITALTTVESLGIGDDGTHSTEKDALLKAKPILESQRMLLLRNVYPAYDFDWYAKMRTASPVDLNKLSPLDRTKFEQIDRVVSRTFATDVQR